MAIPTKQVKFNEIAGLDTFHNGGKGSGNFGHSGRPGEVGGSGKGQGEASDERTNEGDIAQRMKKAGFKKEDIEEYLSDKENLQYRKESVKELKDTLSRLEKARDRMATTTSEEDANDYYKERLEDLAYTLRKGEKRLKDLEERVATWERTLRSWERLK